MKWQLLLLLQALAILQPGGCRTNTSKPASTTTTMPKTLMDSSKGKADLRTKDSSMTAPQFHPCGAACPKEGPCCSQWGFCGNTELHCSPSYGCQSGCWKTGNETLVPFPGQPIPAPADDGFFASGWPVASQPLGDHIQALTRIKSPRFRRADFDAPLRDMASENPHFDARGVFSSCAIKGVVSLTFDDGPSDITDGILDALKAHGNIKATFFVVGRNVEQRPHVLRRILDEGHLIGSHTYSHPHLPTLSDAEIRREMQRTQDAIFKAVGVRTRYMRPPYGELDERVTRLLLSMGYKIFLWNLDTLDWKHHAEQPSKIYDIFYAALHKHKAQRVARSWIPLQHDMYLGTLQQQQRILKAAYKMGYTFSVLNECIRDHDSPYY